LEGRQFTATYSELKQPTMLKSSEIEGFPQRDFIDRAWQSTTLNSNSIKRKIAQLLVLLSLADVPLFYNEQPGIIDSSK